MLNLTVTQIFKSILNYHKNKNIFARKVGLPETVTTNLRLILKRCLNIPCKCDITFVLFVG